MKKILVVGAGFSGAVVARELADAGPYHIDVIDKRNHIGGNCHTETDRFSDVMVHVYGPHIFNTDSEEVWKYVNRFGVFMPFINRVKASTTKGVFSLPINLHTINQFFSMRLDPEGAREFLERLGEKSIETPKNFEEQALKYLGQELYETFIKGYTIKQWGCDPKDLPASILKRLPVRFNYNDNYYSVKYQGIPELGYTKLIEKIITHPNICVSTNTEFEKDMLSAYSHVVYSGPIDQYFSYEYGRLRYRTVTFERLEATGDIQGNAVINYPGIEVPYTRVHEHKHFTPWKSFEKSVAFKEYSKETTANDVPFYPLRLKDDLARLQKYEAEKAKCGNITFIGRLGTYQYLDMDDVISDALNAAQFLKVKLR